MSSAGGRRVAVVTGGGGGIGAAVAEALGRTGAFVVTLDPLVSLDGTERLPAPADTTAGRIVAAGGAARASSASVTDGAAVAALFDELVAEHGRLDAVVNVAGISRPTSFATGSDADWRDVLTVHLEGYANVLRAALPHMAAAGHGRILGVTSGSGWRPADAGAYSAAKRAVAALTWQLGACAPPGVVVNAISPIAVTRMVTAALARAGAGASSRAGGLSLGSMPQPEDLGPLGAHLVGEGFGWCSGTVLFAGGSEVAVIDEPRPLELVRTDPVPSLAHLLEALGPALAAAEADQASGGGSNPRFGPLFDEPAAAELPAPAVSSCALVTDRADVAAVVPAALAARGVACHRVEVPSLAPGFAGAAAALAGAASTAGRVDAVVVAAAGSGRSSGGSGGDGWRRVLDEHDGLVDQLHADASWSRAVADLAATAGRPVRLVTVTDAGTAGGRSRAQAVAQLARAAPRATEGRVAAFAVALDAPEADPALGEVVAHLLCSPDAAALAGAELGAGTGWIALQRHPRPAGSIAYGGPALPPWFDAALARVAGRTHEAGT